jgi:hypothetical protein
LLNTTDGNVADYWHTTTVEKRDKKGNVVLDADGRPVMLEINRPKLFAELTDEQRMRIESVVLNDAGIAVPKLHSAAWANEQLRKLHNIGPTPKDELRSEENVLDKLAELANRLGVKIDLSIE